MSLWQTIEAMTVQERVGLVIFLIIVGLFAAVVVAHIVMSLLSEWAEASVEREGFDFQAEGFTPEALYPVSAAASPGGPRGLGPAFKVRGEPVSDSTQNDGSTRCAGLTSSRGGLLRGTRHQALGIRIDTRA